MLAEEFNPAAFCLQETNLNQLNQNVTFRPYELYHSSNMNGDRGGSCLFVRNGILRSEVPLVTNLQAVAVRLTLHVAITLCSLYIPPSSALHINDLQSLTDQLPKPFLIMGDLNGHNPLWGSDHEDNKGRVIETLMANNNLCVFNDGSHTYQHPATGTTSALDLSIADPVLYNDFTWSVHDDQCGSDHWPTVLVSDLPCEDAVIPKFNFSKADWNQFQSLCDREITMERVQASETPIEYFTETIVEIANKCIPKTSANPRIHKPWFNEEFRMARKQRKAAERRFNKHPTQQNLSSLRILRAKARRTGRRVRRESWRNYVSRVNTRTPVSHVWNMIRKIKGKGSGSNVQHLDADGEVFTSKLDISNKIGETFSKNSSSANYLPEFQRHKDREEKTKLSFRSDNSEDYNSIFSLEELISALGRAHDTASGPDNVHYQLLKHLSESCLKVLLESFNMLWLQDDFPSLWRQATVIPIPKPDKDHTNPTNYRPIALTSCVCKTMERMINNRLIHFLESNDLLANIQCGFRRQRGTLDHLVRLESFVRNAFINKQHAVSLFFDLEKAYDTAWKYGILKDLHEMGLKGHMPLFIKNFLDNREFKVRIGSTYSSFFEAEMGVPQGSILSVTLFSIKINSLAKVLTSNTDGSLFSSPEL